MTIFRSRTLAYDTQNKRFSDPVCILDTGESSVTLTDNKMQQQKIYFHTDFVEKHLRHVAATNPEKLQMLVDEGRIVKYLSDFEVKCMDTASAQTELWLQTDTEYQAAVLEGDIRKAAGLRNGFYQIAKSEVMRTIVLV